MPVNQETRNRLGYKRHVNDSDDKCFYCGDESQKLYCDYVPPMDVAKNAELRAMVTEPFVYVTTCHNCKSTLYYNRYKLRTPEDRKLHIMTKGAKRGTSVDTIRSQLAMDAVRPWQGKSVDENGKVSVIDYDESLLHEDVLRAKREFQKLQSMPASEAQPVSGPSGDDYDPLGLS